PDWAVEQIFLSEHREADPNRSRFFTVRTTEKEPDLVQATLDRLLVDEDGKPLLKKVLMTFDEEALLKNGRETRGEVYESTPNGKRSEQRTSASPSFVTTLLTRQLMNAFGVTDRAQLPFTFELTSADEDPTGDGRFKKAELTFSSKGAALSAADLQKIK